MSNVVTSQPRQVAKINSKELPSSEINCERCREDDDQCCFVYFYSLYCSQCRYTGCCNKANQKRRSPQRREGNYFTNARRPQRHEVNYYSNDNDIMFNDDAYITRRFLYDDNGFIRTYSDHRQSDDHEYGGTTDNNFVPHSECEDHLRDIGSRGHVGSGHHSVGNSEDEGQRVASVRRSGGESHSGEPFELRGCFSDNKGVGGLSGGERPSGTSGSYSWCHSESGGQLSVTNGGGGRCVNEGNSARGDDSDVHCWDRDVSGCKSGSNNAGDDTSRVCERDDTGGDGRGGDTGGDGGGGDTGGNTGGDCGGGDSGGGDTVVDCGGGDTGGDCGGGDAGGDCGGGDTGGDCGGGGDY